MLSKRKIKLISDLIWPPSCIACLRDTSKYSKFHRYICPRCLKQIPRRDPHLCPICKNPTPYKYSLCRDCSKSSTLQGIVVASNYQNPILKEAIHTFKYRRIKSLSFPLASLIYKELVKFFKSLESPKITAPSYSNWLLVPVPATDKKIKHRGFNQAEELARRLHEIFEIPLKTDIIRKCRPTTAQIKTKDAKTRRTNLKKAFSLHPNLAKVQLIGRRVLLVDDVTTTGTTLEECAKVLSPLVYEIWGVTIAK